MVILHPEVVCYTITLLICFGQLLKIKSMYN